MKKILLFDLSFFIREHQFAVVVGIIVSVCGAVLLYNHLRRGKKESVHHKGNKAGHW